MGRGLASTLDGEVLPNPASLALYESSSQHVDGHCHEVAGLARAADVFDV